MGITEIYTGSWLVNITKKVTLKTLAQMGNNVKMGLNGKR